MEKLPLMALPISPMTTTAREMADSMSTGLTLAASFAARTPRMPVISDSAPLWFIGCMLMKAVAMTVRIVHISLNTSGVTGPLLAIYPAAQAVTMALQGGGTRALMKGLGDVLESIGDHGASVRVRSLAPWVTAAYLGLQFMGVAWAISLHLIHSLIMIDSEKRLKETERRLDRTRAAQMAVQMQPHFIFNTLSAIESLCQTDPAAAAESVENLSGYLRGNIDGLTSETLIPFDTELRHIRQYVALEQADPSRQFQFDYELDVRDFTLPALTVQPIVENAVKHGALTHRDGTGRALLTTEALGDYIRITVSDNGLNNSGLTDSQRENRGGSAPGGIGIEATRKRLEALGKRLKALYPKLNIVIITGHQEYALDAFGLDASGYLLKPLTQEAVAHQLSVLRFDRESALAGQGLCIRCFGSFEVYHNGIPLDFSYSKSKELLAVLIDRNGAICSNDTLIGCLWPYTSSRASI